MPEAVTPNASTAESLDGPSAALRFRVVGPGRAGRSFAHALVQAGWEFRGFIGRDDDAVATSAAGVDVLMLTVPDGAIADVAQAIEPHPTTVVCHVAGSRTLDVLAPHARVGSVHPLMSMPDAEIGAQRLVDACTFAICGAPVMRTIVDALGGIAISVAEEDRAVYHATAAVASNHLVALCGQVERLAQQLGVPASAFWKLMTTSLDNAVEVGAKAALTGPVARGDWSTVKAHLDALPEQERPTYLSMAQAAATLAAHDWPSELLKSKKP